MKYKLIDIHKISGRTYSYSFDTTIRLDYWKKTSPDYLSYIIIDKIIFIKI